MNLLYSILNFIVNILSLNLLSIDTLLTTYILFITMAMILDLYNYVPNNIVIRNV